MFFKKSKFIIIFSLVLLVQNSYSDFPIKIRNRQNSISGKRIQNKSIAYKNLKIKNQEEGDVLFFDSNKRSWIAYPVNGLNFIDSWDVESNTPEVIGGGFYLDNDSNRVSVVSGDYFVVKNPGSFTFDGNNSVFFDVGDWLIFNGEFWEKISNNGTISRVWGRKGEVKKLKDDYSWNQVVDLPYKIRPGLNITRSSIFDIKNIQQVISPSLIPDGSVLKWSESENKWKIQRDEKGITGKIESEHIVDGEVTDEDVSEEANIDQEKINGLLDILDLKVNNKNGELFGDLKTSYGLIFQSLPDGKSAVVGNTSMEELHQLVIDLTEALKLKEDQFDVTGPDFYFDETKNFVQLLSSDMVEDPAGEKFLTGDRLFDSILDDLDTVTPKPVIGGVKKDESVIGVIRRFQNEINEKLAGSGFDATNLPEEIVELQHLSNSTTGSENSSLPNGDYQAGFLNYTGGNWEISSVAGGLNFKGTWDPSTSAYPVGAIKGEIYIVNGEGEVNSVSYFKGDWLVCVHPSPVDPGDPAERWLKVNNTGAIESFSGASGSERFGSITPEDNDYTWEMIDKTDSKLENLSDVDISAAGDTLAWSDAQSKWILVNDDDGLGGGNLGAGVIPDGSISEANIDANANIQQTKVLGLITTLSNLLSMDGGTLNGDLDLNKQKLSDLQKINGTEVSSIIDQYNRIKSSLTNKEDIFPTGDQTQFFNESKTLELLTTDAFNESPTQTNNLYLLDSRVFSTPLVNYKLPATPVSSPINSSDNILKSFIKLESQLESGTLQASSLNGADIEDGSITLEKLALESNGQVPKEGDTFTVVEENGKLKWSWSSITGLNYRGKWSPSGSLNEPTPSASKGDFYISDTNAVTSDSRNWVVGDWAIYNGSSWDQISNASSIQRFNDRSGDVMPMKDDYKFDDLDFTDSSIGLISNVDTQTKAPEEGEILKYNGSKWVPSPDYGGLDGLVTTDEVVDGTITSKVFAQDEITESFFTDDLQDRKNDFYRNIGTVSSDLNFSNNDLKNCALINDIDIFSLSQTCDSYIANNYIELFPNPTGPSSEKSSNFLTNKGTFTKVNFSQVDMTSLGNFDDEGLLAMKIPEEFPPEVEEDLSLKTSDTINTAITKLTKRVMSQKVAVVDSRDNPTIDFATDNQKVILVESGNVTIPNGAPTGFSIIIKSLSNAAVDIIVGPSNFIDETENKITLESKYKGVRIVKGREVGKWHIFTM